MKLVNLEVTALARLDLLEIWNNHAEQASIDSADRLLDTIERAVLQIVANPGLGHSRKDLTHRKVLFYFSKPYFIVYRPTKVLVVIRIIHGARDVKKILES